MDGVTLNRAAATLNKVLSGDGLAGLSSDTMHKVLSGDRLAGLSDQLAGLSADDTLRTVRRVFGGGASEQAVLDYCAAPFVHGPALAPEIHQLQATIEQGDPEPLVHGGHERLRHLELDVLATLPSSMAPLASSALPTDLGANVCATVATQLARAEQHEEARQQDEREARERAEASRPAFLESLRTL